VSLSSNDDAVTIPSSVTVPSGATSAGFTATIAAVTTAQTVTLTASAGGATQTFGISLGAAGQSEPGVELSQLSCSQNSITGSGSDACTVTLNGTATGNGLVVNLASNQSAVRVPATVTVPSGATSAGFTATITAVTTAQTATLTASADGATETFGISLGALVPEQNAPGLTMSTSSLNFGDVTVNTQSAPQSVTLTSSGTAPLTINSATPSGTGFKVSGTSFPVTLNPGQTASLTVIFDPTVSGTVSGAISISDNASPSTAAINLTGTGQSTPGVALSRLSCSQNSITGSGSDACTVTLNGAATGNGLTVNLASNQSAVSVPASVTVPAGATTAGFTATVAAVTAAKTATLTASEGGAAQTFGINLGAYMPGLKLSTASLNFGDVTKNTKSAPQSVTLTSSGTAPLTINSAVLSGTGFTVSGATFPATLNPGQTASLTVVFDPTVSGTASGAISISDNASPSTAAVSLSGTGMTGTATLSGLSCATNSLTGSGSDACTVTLTAAAGSGGLAVSLSSTNGAVSVPGSVTVPAGSSSAGFTAAVTAVTTDQTDTLTASSGGVTKNYSINLNASGPALTVGASSLAFGSVNLNSPATQPVTLTSSGTAPLTISAGSATGTGFSISGVSFPTTLNPGQALTLYVQFDPTKAGTASGTVTLTSNASPSTVTIGLSGTGESTLYQVSLTWSAPTNSTDPVAGYNIYRATGSSSSYQLMNSSPETSTGYTDTSVLNGTTYNYYVESVDAQGNQSSPSNTYGASIP
jgi:YbbR domain-containing protein